MGLLSRHRPPAEVPAAGAAVAELGTVGYPPHVAASLEKLAHDAACEALRTFSRHLTKEDDNAIRARDFELGRILERDALGNIRYQVFRNDAAVDERIAILREISHTCNDELIVRLSRGQPIDADPHQFIVEAKARLAAADGVETYTPAAPGWQGPNGGPPIPIRRDD